MGERKATGNARATRRNAKPSKAAPRTGKRARSSTPAEQEPAGLGEVDGLVPSTDPTKPDFDWWPIDRVRVWVRNPRKNARAVPKVADSLKRFGWGRPLVVNDWKGCEGELIAGHTARLAALELGLTRVPVRIRRLPPAIAHALALADNKLGEIADWDPDELGRIAESGEISAEDLALAGFSAAELSALNEPVHPPGDFSEVTIDAHTQYKCPRCQYEWRGQPSAKKAAADAAAE